MGPNPEATAWQRSRLGNQRGGAFSNTYDRWKRRYVVDYLTFNVRWKPLGRVVFNLSDFCIMIGALCAVLGMP
ncbi:MAG: signal peptidase II [Lachnospiraceae bacterium]|uniref:signal peptidase II n=1 Tax=uncultured Acetatifactor sp. TaxID=1671927 RepID=UPI002FE6D2CD|nr:signal peptidase II [Lachnospiraceae bacterium]